LKIKLSKFSKFALLCVQKKYKLKNRSKAVDLFIERYIEETLDFEYSPKFIKRLTKNIEKRTKFPLDKEIMVSFPVTITRENDIFIAHCKKPDVVSHGETLEEAEKNIKEAIDSHIESFENK
jgi:predicted RNase H-like HicB family nuclease